MPEFPCWLNNISRQYTSFVVSKDAGSSLTYSDFTAVAESPHAKAAIVILGLLKKPSN